MKTWSQTFNNKKEKEKQTNNIQNPKQKINDLNQIHRRSHTHPVNTDQFTF